VCNRAGSLFFAFQLMTTIGYGTFVPVTAGGRAFTVVFGVVGITSTGFFLGSCANSLNAFIAWVLSKCLRRWRRRRRRGGGGAATNKGGKAAVAAANAPAPAAAPTSPAPHDLTKGTGPAAMPAAPVSFGDHVGDDGDGNPRTGNPHGVSLRARGAAAMVLLLAYMTLGSCYSAIARRWSALLKTRPIWGAHAADWPRKAEAWGSPGPESATAGGCCARRRMCIWPK